MIATRRGVGHLETPRLGGAKHPKFTNKEVPHKAVKGLHRQTVRRTDIAFAFGSPQHEAIMITFRLRNNVRVGLDKKVRRLVEPSVKFFTSTWIP